MSRKNAPSQRTSAKRRSVIVRVRPPMYASSRTRIGPVKSSTSVVGGSMTRVVATTRSGTATRERPGGLERREVGIDRVETVERDPGQLARPLAARPGRAEGQQVSGQVGPQAAPHATRGGLRERVAGQQQRSPEQGEERDDEERWPDGRESGSAEEDVGDRRR